MINLSIYLQLYLSLYIIFKKFLGTGQGRSSYSPFFKIAPLLRAQVNLWDLTVGMFEDYVKSPLQPEVHDFSLGRKRWVLRIVRVQLSCLIKTVLLVSYFRSYNFYFLFSQFLAYCNFKLVEPLPVNAL